MDLLGTGFFISNNGVFVSARHVLAAPFDEKGTQRYSIAILQFHEQGHYLIRPILRCTSHPLADVSVGVAAPMRRDSDGTQLMNKVVHLTMAPPDIGARIITYAYPRYASGSVDGVQVIHWMPAFYDGHLTEYLPDGRDRVLLPGPCYRTSMIIHHGASGGPVFCRSGAVFALNSTGFDGTDDSYVSRIDEIFDLRIDDVVIGSQPATSVSIKEMALAGHVLLERPAR